VAHVGHLLGVLSGVAWFFVAGLSLALYTSIGFHLGEAAPQQELQQGLYQLHAAVDLAALRIVQEAVANVRRHAGASRCTVVIERVPGELRLRIEDDGRGIPPRLQRGIGLTSIRDRARELGGSATIGSSPDGGACIVVRLPFVDPHPLTAEVLVA
jgi:signal transduction histidine kinase